jgi:hypothetical protein
LFVHTKHNDDKPGDPDYNPERCHLERWLGFEVLAPVYPGHTFSVWVYDNGGFSILDLRYPQNLRMNIPNAPHAYSISAFKKAVLMAYGEWLERTQQKRAKYDDGFVITHVDGAEEKYQPRLNG